MRFDRFDLNLLVSLDALLNELSVTRAAQRVFISQSAMSYTLARLRQHFGDPLLTNAGRALMLTPFGRQLVEPVQQSLREMRVLLALRPTTAIENVKRRMKVVSSDHITLTLLAEVFREASEIAPGLSLELQSVAHFEGATFESGTVDLLIGARNVLNPRHPAEPLIHDRLVALVAAENSSIGEVIQLEEYLDAEHVITRWNDGRVVTIEQRNLDERGLSRQDAIVVPDFNLVPGFVVGTRRIATVPRLLAQLLTRQWPVRIVEIDAGFPPIEIQMQWHRLNEADPVINWVRQRLCAARAAWEDSITGAAHVSHEWH